MEHSSELFTAAWMEIWKDAINSSSTYKKEGSSWKEPLILKFSTPAEPPLPDDSTGFWLDLNQGSCREIRYATSDDETRTSTILSAQADNWVRIIREKKDPLFMLMQGALRLEKGSLLKLSSHRKSAAALLEAAHEASFVNTDTFSDGNTPVLFEKETAAGLPGNGAARSFTTTKRGLDFNAFPMQLFQKSKQLGIWNPSDISFEKDKIQWQSFNELEQRVLLHLSSMFAAGEEAVTLDLLPLIQITAKDGLLEDEIYLTSFLWEEAKHTEFFSIFLQNVVKTAVDMEQFHGPAYKALFYDELHEALHGLQQDDSPESRLRASFTYNMIIEGTLAETGYEAYFRMLTDNEMLPGLREGIGLLKRDESRHIAYGLFFIQRLMNEHPELEKTLEQLAGKLLPMAIDVVHEIFEPYPEMPFGLDKSWYIEYASNQFSKRIQKLTA